jgi:hypothetical protein
MRNSFQFFFIVLFSFLAISAEICLLHPNIHGDVAPKTSIEPYYLKKDREDLRKSIMEIHAFKMPNLSSEVCTIAKALMTAYGEAVIASTYPTSIEEFERYRPIKTLTFGALGKFVNSNDFMESLHLYYYSFSKIKHSFPIAFEKETKELIKSSKEGNTQAILNSVENCIEGYVFDKLDDSERDNEIKKFSVSDEKANLVITLKNSMKQKFMQGFVSKPKINRHYTNLLQSTFDKLKISPNLKNCEFSFLFVYLMLFKILQEGKPDDTFDLIFANHPLSKVADIKKHFDLLALLRKSEETFTCHILEEISPDLKGNEQVLKDLEELAIPIVKENFSKFTKRATNESNGKTAINKPPGSDSKILIYLLPFVILIIACLIFFFVRKRQLQKKEIS